LTFDVVADLDVDVDLDLDVVVDVDVVLVVVVLLYDDQPPQALMSPVNIDTIRSRVSRGPWTIAACTSPIASNASRIAAHSSADPRAIA